MIDLAFQQPVTLFSPRPRAQASGGRKQYLN